MTLFSSLMQRTGAALVLGAVLATSPGCEPAPVGPASSVELSPPAVDEVLYPTRAESLLSHPALAHLPADLAWVVVADLPALMEVSPLGELLASETGPYDRAIEAASVHAVGMVLGRQVGHLRDAGLDPSSPWGMAQLDGGQVVFGRVTDPKALAARLEQRASKEERDLGRKALGGGTLFEVERDHALWLVDDLAYLIHGRSGRATKVARALGEVTADEALDRQPAFVQARDGVRFGRHAAAFVSLKGEVEALSLAPELAYLERRYEELETWLEKEDASTDPRSPDDETKLEEVRDRLRHKEREIARMKERQAQVAALPPLLGVALGFDVHASTLRGKAYLPLPEGLGAKLFGPATLPSVDRPSNDEPAAFEPAPNPRWHLPLSPRAALEMATRTVGTTQSRALYRWLADRAGAKGDPIRPLLSGAIARSHHDVDGKRHYRLELGLVPKAASTIRGWLDRIEPATGEGDGAERHGDRIRLPGERQDLWLGVAEGSVVVASHEQLLEVEPRRRQGDEPALVTALDLLAPSDGHLSLPAASFIPATAASPWGGDALIRSRIGSALAMMTPMSMGRATGSSDRDDLEKKRKERDKKRKRLQKRRAQVRAQLATLQNRHRIETRSGRSRLLTALGTSVARVRPTAEGVTFYFAQRIAETDVAALGEHAIYALVDSSSESETAQRIRQLEEKLDELDDELEKLPPIFAMGGFIDLGDISAAGGSLGRLGTTNLVAPSGIGRSHGGGGRIGGLGKVDTGGDRAGLVSRPTGKAD